MAPNVQAIKQWIKNNRPDVPSYQVDAIMENQGIFAMMAMAFEAGRDFQNNNPKAGRILDPFTQYVIK